MGREIATANGSTKKRRQLSAGTRFATGEILILCPSATKNSGVLETLYALYFLPANYRVRVEGKSDLLLEEIYQLFRDDTVAARIDWNVENAEYQEKGKLQPASPFSFADVVVYGNTQVVEPEMLPQSLVVFNLAARTVDPQEDRRFRVCQSAPEALASSILQVVR